LKIQGQLGLQSKFQVSLGYTARSYLRNKITAGHWWLMTVTLTAQEAKTRRITV
jgi:hypothetical protein